MSTTTQKTEAARLNPAETVALSKVLTDAALKAAKRGLEPGEYQIDAMIHVFGSLRKGQDTEGIIAQRAAPWKLLAAAMQMLNGVCISKIVREAENIREEDEKELKVKVQEAFADIKETVVGTIAGKVTGKVYAEKV